MIRLSTLRRTVSVAEPEIMAGTRDGDATSGEKSHRRYDHDSTLIGVVVVEGIY